MPFTSDQLAYAGKLAMDYERKQNPEDLYNTVRPLLKALNATKQPFPVPSSTSSRSCAPRTTATRSGSPLTRP